MLAAGTLALAAPAVAQDCTLQRAASLDMQQETNDSVVVPIGVNGTIRNFFVATAASHSQLSETVVSELKLPTRSLSQFTEVYTSTGYKFDRGVTIDSLTIGNNEAKYFHVLVGPPNTTTDPKQPAGVLGADMLSVFDIEFDFANKKLNFFSQDHCEGKVVYWSSSYVEVPFKNMGGVRVDFEMQLDGKTVRVRLNSGSQHSVLSPVGEKLFGVYSDSPGSEAVPGKSDLYRHQFKTLALQGITISNPVLYLESSAADDAFRKAHPEKQRGDPIYGANLDYPEIDLGLDILQHLRFYIAYKEKKIYATAAEAPK
jgi:hypothetical protein